MKFLLLGLMTLVLTTITMVLMTKAVFLELRERAGREKSNRRD